jgi:hypothetical protein
MVAKKVLKEQKAGHPAVVSPPTSGARISGPLMVIGDKVPAHIKQDTARGTENLTASDLVIPRLEIVQALSPALSKNDPGFIKGAVAGMLNNSVTRELYGDSVLVVPVWYAVQYLVWRDRKKGRGEGGFFGAYPTQREAQERADSEGGTKANIIVNDTPTHLCLLLNDKKGTTEEIMISMPRTKAKISRQWNSAVLLGGGDRFSRAYRISTMFVKNTKGEFYNVAVQQAGFPTKEVYERAENLYGKVSSGERKLAMDTRFMDRDAAGDDDDVKM